jgi:hypothetical protein
MSDERATTTITITNATSDERTTAFAEIALAIEEGGTNRAGERWVLRAVRVEDGDTGFGCEPSAIPSWIRETHNQREWTVDGQRYVSDGAIVLAARGVARVREAKGPQRVMVAMGEATIAGLRASLVPLDSFAADAGPAYLTDSDGTYPHDYRCDIAPNPQAFAVRYVAAVEKLYPGVTWRSGSEYAQAWDVEGRVVAVLMPTTDKART